MHGNAGGRRGRPLAQPLHGLRGLVHRAKLSNAAGYDAHEAPRVPNRPKRDNLL